MQILESINNKERQLASMPAVPEDEASAMSLLFGLTSQMIGDFSCLEQGMYSHVGVPDNDKLHVDPRIRAIMKDFRDQVGCKI